MEGRSEEDAVIGGTRVPDDPVELRSGHESVEEERSGEAEAGLSAVVLPKKEMSEAGDTIISR